MSINVSFVQLIFTLMAIIIGASLGLEWQVWESPISSAFTGTIVGAFFAFLLIYSDKFFRRYQLHSLNVAALGILFGCFFGFAVNTLFQSIFSVVRFSINQEIITFLQLMVYLSTVYLGLIMTARSSEEFHLVIPFVRFKANETQKKDVLLDFSALLDSRIVDLAASGLLDCHLVIPRFMIKDLQRQLETNDDCERAQARKSLDVVKRLESIDTLDLRFVDTDFPEVKDSSTKLQRLARFLNANILTSDISRVKKIFN